MNANLKINFLEADKTQNLQVVDFDGEFDKAGFAEIKDELTNFVKAFELKSLIFDFGKLKYINSEGIGFLMEVHTHLIQRDRKLVVVSLNANVKDIFTAIGIADIVPVFDSLNDYLNSATK
ncbi:MAG: STAS domain-containing protein [Candidatus Peregrinibacteria bacterium]|nr:STAS domain-containing protein [Candidatus Peregrinibacteria bacterium]